MVDHGAMTEEEALDLVVQMADKADNCLHTAKLPLPASIHAEGLRGALEQIRDGLNRALLVLAKTERVVLCRCIDPNHCYCGMPNP